MKDINEIKISTELFISSSFSYIKYINSQGYQNFQNIWFYRFSTNGVTGFWLREFGLSVSIKTKGESFYYLLSWKSKK